MHIIPVLCDGECPEWTMIEMQGELERKGAIDPDQEFSVGQLRLSKTVSLLCHALWPSSHSLCMNRNSCPGRRQAFIGHCRASSFLSCCLAQRADTVELTIGYHLLEGKMVDLKKPFAILEKQSTPVDVDAMEEDGSPQCNTEYKVEHPFMLITWHRVYMLR